VLDTADGKLETPLFSDRNEKIFSCIQISPGNIDTIYLEKKFWHISVLALNCTNEAISSLMKMLTIICLDLGFWVDGSDFLVVLFVDGRRGGAGLAGEEGDGRLVLVGDGDADGVAAGVVSRAVGPQVGSVVNHNFVIDEDLASPGSLEYIKRIINARWHIIYCTHNERGTLRVLSVTEVHRAHNIAGGVGVDHGAEGAVAVDLVADAAHGVATGILHGADKAAVHVAVATASTSTSTSASATSAAAVGADCSHKADDKEHDQGARHAESEKNIIINIHSKTLPVLLRAG
jgi:hypothetical protein